MIACSTAENVVGAIPFCLLVWLCMLSVPSTTSRQPSNPGVEEKEKHKSGTGRALLLFACCCFNRLEVCSWLRAEVWEEIFDYFEEIMNDKRQRCGSDYPHPLASYLEMLRRKLRSQKRGNP